MFRKIMSKITLLMGMISFIFSITFSASAAQEVRRVNSVLADAAPASVTPIRVDEIPLRKLPPFDAANIFFRFDPQGTDAQIKTILYRTYWVGPGSGANPVQQPVVVITSKPEGLFYDNKNLQINFFYQGTITVCANVKPGWQGRTWKIYSTGNCNLGVFVEEADSTHEAQLLIEMLLKN